MKKEHEDKHPNEEINEPAAEAVDQPQDQLLRLKADFENIKKRLERDKQDAIKYANEKLLLEILPIVDHLDRAMASLAEGHDAKKVEQGLKIAQTELHDVLGENGVEIVKSVGAEFDPKIHEAIATVDDAKLKEGTVVDEMQRGYLLNGRLIRPSRVRVVQHTTNS